MNRYLILIVCGLIFIQNLYSQKTISERKLQNYFFSNVFEYGRNIPKTLWMDERFQTENYEGLNEKQLAVISFFEIPQSSRELQIVIDELLLLDIQPGDTIVDLGACNGVWEARWIMASLAGRLEEGYSFPENIHVIGLDIDSFALGLSGRLFRYCRGLIDFQNLCLNTAALTDSQYISWPESFSYAPVKTTFTSAVIADESVDKLICIRTLHHLPLDYLPELYRVIKPGGKLLITDMAVKKSHKKRCGDSLKEENIFYLTEKEMIGRLENVGFFLEDKVYSSKRAANFLFYKD